MTSHIDYIRADDFFKRRLKARMAIRREEIGRSIYSTVKEVMVSKIDDGGGTPLSEIVNMIALRVNREIESIVDKILEDAYEIFSDFMKYTLPKIGNRGAATREGESKILEAYERDLADIKRKMKEICTSDKIRRIYRTLSVIEEASKRGEEPLTYFKIAALLGKSEGTVKAHTRELEKLGHIRVNRSSKPYQIIFVSAPWI